MNARDEHRTAVENALHASNELKKLFDALGSADRPNGKLTRAYRLTRAALRAEMQGAARAQAITQMLADLRGQVNDALESEFTRAVKLGEAQAARDLTIYAIAQTDSDTQNIDEALHATLLGVDRQIASLAAASTIGTLDEALGDEERVGVLSFGSVLRDATFWIVALAASSYNNITQPAAKKNGAEFKRQAIAAIDENTTDCCLRVQAQLVGMNEKFHLTGTPRFADYLPTPPFHTHCRTSTALVRAQVAQDDLSKEMRDAADYEMQQRELYGRKEIHPANAVSRRTN